MKIKKEIIEEAFKEALDEISENPPAVHLKPGAKFPEGVIIKDDDGDEECEKDCQKEQLFELITKLTCAASGDSRMALTLSIIAIIVSLVSIILH